MLERMRRFRLSQIVFCLPVVLCGTSICRAAEDSLSVQIKSGVGSLSLSAGSNYLEQDGGMGLEIRPQVNYELSAISMAFALFYQGRLGSNFGAFPLSRVGIGVYYYPFDLPLSSVDQTDSVTISNSHIAPFITAQTSMVTVRVTDVSIPTRPVSFNGFALGVMVGGGLELPVGKSTALIAEVLYESTLMGGTSNEAGADSGSGLSFNSFSGFMGFSVRP